MTEAAGGGQLTVNAVEGLPEITEGANLGALVAGRAALAEGDVVAVAQKVVSKAEGRLRRLADVTPSGEARQLAGKLDKDPRLVELILAESVRVIRAERGVLIVETRGGQICANAGIDASNVGAEDSVTLLPEDPDASARRIRAELIDAGAPARIAVLVTDSFGRPWRLGQSEVAIGCAGLLPLDDWRGRRDRNGRELAATAIAIADQVAAAADLARDKTAGLPVVCVRGLGHHVTEDVGPGVRALLRPGDEDLFR